jgi:hypothetical protein
MYWTNINGNSFRTEEDETGLAYFISEDNKRISLELSTWVNHSEFVRIMKF